MTYIHSSNNLEQLNNHSNTSKKLFKLVHFGCWNKGGCNHRRTNPLSFVRKELQQIDKEQNIDFYLVAGDNYYQEKQNDKQIVEFSEKQFTEGFKCLSTLKGHKYILLGNHDTTAIPRYYNTTEVKPKHVCHTLHKEIEFTNKPEHKSHFTMIKPSTTQHLYLPHSKTLFVLLDTNLLQDDEYDIKKVLECSIEYYNELPGEYLKVEDFVEAYITQLLEATQKYITGLGVNNLIFVGHHPIYGIKSKFKLGVPKNKGQNFSQTGLDLLINIIKMCNPESVYHLCADIHNYQQNNLVITHTDTETTTYNIKQYITGTGGAHQDDLPVPIFKPLKLSNYTINYDLTDSMPKGNYGFLFLEERSDGELLIEFKYFNYESVIKSLMKKTKTKKKDSKRFRSSRSSRRKSFKSKRK
jgi:hypothetical protein